MKESFWKDITFVAFDTEATGKYPLTAEICELAAVKWRGGQIIDTFSTLLKPSQLMNEGVIRIHGITNEMVESAPKMADKIREFHSFVQDAIVIAHHAPFDLGFIAVDFETAGLSLPPEPVICSSLLSRKIISDSKDHRLQTLIPHLNIEQGQAHRALDDAKACLQVALICMQRMGDVPMPAVFAAQGGPLTWQRFSMKVLADDDRYGAIVQSSREGGEIEFVYSGGSKPGSARRLRPVGVVRSLDGDFFVGLESGETQTKRYFLDKVASSRRLI